MSREWFLLDDKGRILNVCATDDLTRAAKALRPKPNQRVVAESLITDTQLLDYERQFPGGRP